MAERRARHDAYGRPLPTLTDVREQSLLDSPANLEARRFLQRLLEDTYRQYLTRGRTAHIEISFVVADGTIQEQIWVGAKQKHEGWRARGDQ